MKVTRHTDARCSAAAATAAATAVATAATAVATAATASTAVVVGSATDQPTSDCGFMIFFLRASLALNSSRA